MATIAGELRSTTRAADGLARRAATFTRSWWPLALIALWLFVIAFPGVIAPDNPNAIDVNAILQPPSVLHWLGTDEAGRDVFSRCVWGLRYSVGAALIVSFGSALVGTTIGGLAALGGKWVDTLVMRLTDVFLAFPYLVLAIVLAASIGPGLWTCVITLVILWWPSYARMTRGQLLALRELAFVDGARAALTSRPALFYRHLLPHLLPQITARLSMEVGYVIIALTGLGFLGLGAQPPTPELGAILADAHNYMIEAWWYATFPGLFILAAVVSAMAIGDWLGGRRGP